MKARFISSDQTETPTEFLGYKFPVNIWVEIDDKDAGTLSSHPAFEVKKAAPAPVPAPAPAAVPVVAPVAPAAPTAQDPSA